MAKVELIRPALAELLYEPGVRTLLMSIADDVKGTAEASAVDAGGTSNAGYSAAGFSAEWEPRSKRPRAIVRSNLNDGTQWRVHFATIKRWGIAHLRRALYAHTTRGG